MIVFSPLALYTTYLGWQQYDVLFDALWQTGLLYVGFLVIAYRFLKNVLAPAGSTQHAADYALNHFLYELATTFLICSLFVYPCVPLEQKGLSFKPLCTLQKGTTPATINDTGTTYDEAFADVLTHQVKIPLGFSILQNYISSLTYGLMKVTGCTDSLQAIQGDLVSTYIPTPVRQQALQFHKQCFLEARNAYFNEPHTLDETKQIDAILKRHGGEEDLNWMGSKTLSTFYYHKMTSREPVTGFTFINYPNPNFEHAAKNDPSVKAHMPENGYPTCTQWWAKIRTDLVAASEKAGYFDKHLGKLDVANRVATYKMKHALAWNSDITPNDYIAKILLADSREMQIKSTESFIDPTNNNISTFLSRSLIDVGQSFKSWSSTPLKREATLQTIPVMHAFFYFFLIVLTPIVLALSGYSPRALGSLCALFVVAIFMQYIWHLVAFVERSVLDPMGENHAVAAMRNMAVLFYIIAPGLLLKLSSHFGGEAGAQLSQMMGHSEQTVNDSSETSIRMAKTAVNTLVRK
jgi:hypothetical protein